MADASLEEATGSWRRFYVPEIHDVHPEMECDLDTLLGVLPPAARDICAVLIVPNWQDRAPLMPDHPLVARLHRHAGLKVLHGWTHSRGPSVMSWIFTGHDDRGEFGALDGPSAERRLVQAEALLAPCLGTPPTWFCPPQHRLSPAGAEVLARRGPRNAMRWNRFELEDGTRVPLEVVSYDVGRRRFMQAINLSRMARQTARLLETGTPFRLALHPADRIHAPCWRAVGRLIERLERDGWEALGPEDAVRRWRHRGTEPVTS